MIRNIISTKELVFKIKEFKQTQTNIRFVCGLILNTVPLR